MQLYQTVMKCKNLGIAIDATQLDLAQLDAIYTIHTSIEDVNKAKGRKHE